MDIQRTRTKRGDILPVEVPKERQVSGGSVNRVNTDIVTEDTSLSMATSDIPSAISLPDTDPTEEIARRAAPLTSNEDIDAAGADAVASMSRTSPSRSFQSRLQRPSRTIRNRTTGERPVRQNSLTPQTPIPLSSDYNEVRSGQTNLNITDALRSAATMVDANSQDIRRRESRPATYQLRERRTATRHREKIWRDR